MTPQYSKQAGAMTLDEALAASPAKAAVGTVAGMPLGTCQYQAALQDDGRISFYKLEAGRKIPYYQHPVDVGNWYEAVWFYANRNDLAAFA